MANPQVILDFVANTAGLAKAFKETSQQAGGTGKAFGKLGKAAVVAGGAAGLGVLGVALHTGIEEFSEAQKVGAQTTAVIKSTGGAANVTATQVSSMAEALMKKSGMDDEAIQSGENLLLTFSSIRNEAGKGNDVFNQATKTMLDMSVALGQDTTQSAMQLGKALNDPVKGMTALRRVGVQFTADQEKQIKAMVAAGDTMGAQKLILAELNREFGGSAEAMGKTLPGQVNILKQSFSNLAGEMVGSVAPAMQAVFGFMAEHPGLVKALTFAILGLAAAMVIMNIALAVTSVVASPVALVILGIVVAVAALAAAAYLIYANWGAITEFFVGIWDTIKAGVSSVLGWLRSNWPLLLPIILGPLGAILALVITHWSQIRNAVTTAVNAIRTVVSAAWSAIQSIVSAASSAIQAAVSAAWGAVQSIVTTAVNAIRAAVNALTPVFNAAKTAVSALADALRGPLQAAAGVAKGALSGLQGIISTIAGAFDSAASAVGRLVDAIGRIPSRINLPSIPNIPGIPGLAKGGIVKRPTLAMVGEKGAEAVVPLRQLRGLIRQAGESAMEYRQAGAGQPLHVRVYIGNTELRGLVRTEIVDVNSGIARTLLAGAS